jgi:hypothetical protein
MKSNLTYLQAKVEKAEKIRGEIRLAKVDPAYLKTKEIQILQQKLKAGQDILKRIQGTSRLQAAKTS